MRDILTDSAKRQKYLLISLAYHNMNQSEFAKKLGRTRTAIRLWVQAPSMVGDTLSDEILMFIEGTVSELEKEIKKAKELPSA